MPIVLEMKLIVLYNLIDVHLFQCSSAAVSHGNQAGNFPKI